MWKLDLKKTRQLNSWKVLAKRGAFSPVQCPLPDILGGQHNFSSTLLKIYDEISIYLMLLLRGDHRILFMVFEVISSLSSSTLYVERKISFREDLLLGTSCTTPTGFLYRGSKNWWMSISSLHDLIFNGRSLQISRFNLMKIWDWKEFSYPQRKR